MSLRALLWKDLRTEMRGKEALQAGLVLVALVFLVYVFAFHDLSGSPRAATAVLWIPLVFATAACAGRGMAAEHDHGTLELLRTAPVALAWVGASRTLTNLLLTLPIAAATLLLARLLFHVPVTAPLVALLAAATLGLTIVATLAGGLAAGARAREALLPILVVPVAAPLVQAGVTGSLLLMGGGGWDDVRAPLLLVLGYDAVVAGAAWLLWPSVLEADA